MKKAQMIKLTEVRMLVAAYMQSKGCSCCEGNAEHALAKLLKVRKYTDGSGYDFSRYAPKIH